MAQLFWPFPTSTVSEWPGQRKGSYHVGTDFAVPQGTPLRATVDGIITRHNNDGLGAYVLDIISDDGLLVRNGHLSRMDVNTGQRVKAGDVIGLTGGARGTAGAGNSDGPHLHWELRRDRAWVGGAWVDPRNLNPQPSTFGQQTIELEKFMRLAWSSTDGKGYLVTEDGFYHLPDMAHYELFKRLMKSTPDTPDAFNNTEIEKMNGVLQTLAKRNASFNGTVTAQVDYTKIAKTVLDEEARRLQS